MTDQMAVFIDFENVALWAEREFIDFDITAMMNYLKSRGPTVVKRAYGDFSRFARYREELMDNSIDLIQIFSVRQGKNRADIRMAIDAFEIAMTRPQINNYIIVSGDSDFGPLVAKLREYGKYTLGIGPRSITHYLLVKSFDEFTYMETALGERTEEVDQVNVEREQARNILLQAMQVLGQRGEVPVLATRLKQTMLLIDPAFNEANFGYSQFKNWLDDNLDLIRLYLKDFQLYVAPREYKVPAEFEFNEKDDNHKPNSEHITGKQNLESQYRQLYSRLRMLNVDLTTRRDVLRDIYRCLSEIHGDQSTDSYLDQLHDRYEAQGLIRSKAVLRDILQMAFRQRAFDYHKQPPSLFTPVWLADGIDSEADFVSLAESDFPYQVIRAGLELDAAEIAQIVVNDRNQGDYIQTLLEDLRQRGQIVRSGKTYSLPGHGPIPFLGEPALEILRHDIEVTQLPEGIQIDTETAHMFARKAMVQRSQDFAASGSTYLLACRVQKQAVEQKAPGASLEDLRWFMASYASAVAGKLSQVNHDYSGARPYYLAFFALVQEDDPLWSRMRGLINPMLAYYWVNAGRELDLNVASWTISMSSPAHIAVLAATHSNAELRRLWKNITLELAKVNSNLLRRISNQLKLSSSELPENGRVAEQIDQIINSLADD